MQYLTCGFCSETVPRGKYEEHLKAHPNQDRGSILKIPPNFELTNGKNRFKVQVTEESGVALIRFQSSIQQTSWEPVVCQTRLTPKRARELARWLERYAEWEETR